MLLLIRQLGWHHLLYHRSTLEILPTIDLATAQLPELYFKVAIKVVCKVKQVSKETCDLFLNIPFWDIYWGFFGLLCTYKATVPHVGNIILK